jgi:hypothetical protein
MCLLVLCRWGQVYGGRQWRWPWSLTDSEGYTALHLAARQADAGVCVGLIDTIKRMLPGQIPAAHTAWLHEQGGVGRTASQIFTVLNPHGTSDSLWEQQSSASAKPGAASESQGAAGSSSLTSAASASRGSAARGAESAKGAAADPTVDASTDSEPLPSFWGLMQNAVHGACIS